MTTVVKLDYLFESIFFLLTIRSALFCGYIKQFLQHALEHSVRFCPLNFKKDLVKLEKTERKAGNITNSVEQLPEKRNQRSLSISV